MLRQHRALFRAYFVIAMLGLQHQFLQSRKMFEAYQTMNILINGREACQGSDVLPGNSALRSVQCLPHHPLQIGVCEHNG